MLPGRDRDLLALNAGTYMRLIALSHFRVYDIIGKL